MNDDELQQLSAEPVTVRAAGESIEVRPLTVGQLPGFARALKGVSFDWSGESLDLVKLIADHGDALIDAAAVATGRPRDWVASLGLDEFSDVVTVVIEVNADFFVRRLLPQFKAAAEKLGVAGSISLPA